MAIASLAGGKTIAEIAQQRDVHPNRVTEWRRQLLERDACVFAASSVPPGPPVHIEAAHSKIGQLTLDNGFLEGALSRRGLLVARR